MIEDTIPYEMQVLMQHIREFNQARDWEKYHTPENLAKAISVEASELLEDFLWKDASVYTGYHERAEEEIADIFIYMLSFCDKMGIDPIIAATKKIIKNGEKYPVNKCKGRSEKYDRL